jgi:hypothetical protein
MTEKSPARVSTTQRSARRVAEAEAEGGGIESEEEFEGRGGGLRAGSARSWRPSAEYGGGRRGDGLRRPVGDGRRPRRVARGEMQCSVGLGEEKRSRRFPRVYAVAFAVNWA